MVEKKQLAVMLLGSESDLKHVVPIEEIFEQLGILYHIRIGSAHKINEYVVAIVGEYLAGVHELAFITVAGLSDALSASLKGHLRILNPSILVVGAPPYNDKYPETIFAGTQLPDGISVDLKIRVRNAAWAVADNFSGNNLILREKVIQAYKDQNNLLIEADLEQQAKNELRNRKKN